MSDPNQDPPRQVSLKASPELLAPLKEILANDPLVSLHAAVIECLREGINTLSKDPERLFQLVRAEKARQRLRHGKPGPKPNAAR